MNNTQLAAMIRRKQRLSLIAVEHGNRKAKKEAEELTRIIHDEFRKHLGEDK